MAFRFKNFWKVLKNCVNNMTDINLYRTLFGDINTEPGNISKIVNGKNPVPMKNVRDIVIQGPDEVEQRLMSIFLDKDVCKKIEGSLIVLENRDDNKWISEYLNAHKADTIQKKLAHLFLVSLVDGSKDTSNIPKSIFEFLNNENINNICEVNIMFHSGMNWYEDRSNNGRGALLKNMVTKGIQVKVVINNSKAVQQVFESKYLNGEYGVYDSVDVCTKKWIEIAAKYKIALKSFEHIFFHSLCIVHYRDKTGKIYLTNYVYAKNIIGDNPRLIFSSEDDSFKKYCEEYNFIWNKSTELYNPKG